jgi:hypothetical protein
MSFLIPDIQDVEPFALQQSLKGPDALNIHVIMPEDKKFSEHHTHRISKSRFREDDKNVSINNLLTISKSSRSQDGSSHSQSKKGPRLHIYSKHSIEQGTCEV